MPAGQWGNRGKTGNTEIVHRMRMNAEYREGASFLPRATTNNDRDTKNIVFHASDLQNNNGLQKGEIVPSFFP